MGKINQETAQEIIDAYIEGKSTQELSKQYKLWTTTICNLISGRSWKKCKRPLNIKDLIEERHERGLFKEGQKCHIDAPPLTSLQEDIIIGSLLGDGSINDGKANARFSKKQCVKFKDYLFWHDKILSPYTSNIIENYSNKKIVNTNKKIIKYKNVKKHLSAFQLYTHQHPVFTVLRKKWYKGKIKIIPSDLRLNEQIIAIWFWDDGSNDCTNRCATICTQCFTLEEVDFLKNKFVDFDVFPEIHTIISPYTSREMPILKFYGKSYDNLINLIKPYCLWDCMSHKVKWRKAQEAWEYSGKFSLEEAQNVIELRKTLSAKEIAKIYGVHVNTIYAMVSGRSWKHLQR